ncbi:hypothetical protein NZK32_11870 [Cyanobium sp. FGCU-52]|nr:hypothetical protein [Cyanobium sp. FGCU52]
MAVTLRSGGRRGETLATYSRQKFFANGLHAGVTPTGLARGEISKKEPNESTGHDLLPKIFAVPVATRCTFVADSDRGPSGVLLVSLQKVVDVG